MKSNILLLHGALGSKEQFIEIKTLLEKHFNVYSFNFDGHGGQKTDFDFSIDHFVNNTIEFLNENKLIKCNIFGYSMGGYVALKLAASNPEHAGKIITLGTKFDWSPESTEREIKMMDAGKIEIKLPDFAETLKKRHLPADWKIVMQKTADVMHHLGSGHAMTENEFSKIHSNVLILLGSEDKMVSITESEKIISKISNSKFKLINKAPHQFELADKQTLVQTIIDFINS